MNVVTFRILIAIINLFLAIVYYITIEGTCNKSDSWSLHLILLPLTLWI